MKYSSFWLGLALACGIANAADSINSLAATQKTTNLVNVPLTPRVTAVTSNGPGQAGYVHYFLITHPDGSLEHQVGVETDDQRIAWSFPDAGVIVSEFIKAGVLHVNDRPFKVEHLHGIRPFTNDAEMRVLQKELTQRVAFWVDNDTPYCLFRQPDQRFCLNCGDFLVRILYPGASPLVPSLPRDFLHQPRSVYAADNLLMYLIGLHNLPDKNSRLATLATMNLPASLRNDIREMIDTAEPDTQLADAETSGTPAAPTAAPKPAAKPVPATKVAITRRLQGKRL